MGIPPDHVAPRRCALHLNPIFMKGSDIFPERLIAMLKGNLPGEFRSFQCLLQIMCVGVGGLKAEHFPQIGLRFRVAPQSRKCAGAGKRRVHIAGYTQKGLGCRRQGLVRMPRPDTDVGQGTRSVGIVGRFGQAPLQIGTGLVKAALPGQNDTPKYSGVYIVRRVRQTFVEKINSGTMVRSR